MDFLCKYIRSGASVCRSISRCKYFLNNRANCNFWQFPRYIMERWQNKVAVVTGASSGIGAAVAADLVKAGFKVAALARRDLRLRKNKLALPANLQERYHPIKCDVSDEEQVVKAFEWIDRYLGGTDVLINNAGIVHHGEKLTNPRNTGAIQETTDINVMGVVYCVREAFDSMKRREVDGHIVIINSVGGHYIPNIPGMNFNIYPATKFAVTAMVETYRQEFANAGTKVKVTSISPGAVATEIFRGLGNVDDLKAAGNPFLNPEDISSAILFALGTPPHVQVHEMIIKPIGELC